MALRRHMSGDIDISPAMWRSWWTGLTPAIPIRCAPGTRLWRENPRVVVRLQPYSAQLAAQLGLPFAFASHFGRICCSRRCIFIAATSNRQHAGKTIRDGVHQYYRRRQQPRAEFLFTSMQQAFVKLRRGETGNCRRRFKIWISSGHRLSSWRAAGAEYVVGR